MNCVILQPSYIPWRGFFHLIYKADLFIFYDDAKYDKNGWRNRNRIKTPQGLKWLTIPVYGKGVESQHIAINQMAVCWTKDWISAHFDTICMSYRKAPFFKQYLPLLEDIFSCKPRFLSEFTIDATVKLARALGITHTKFMCSSELQGISGVKTNRLIQILKQVGATHYISGPSARNYLEEEQFDQAGITLEYMTYAYPEYPQLYPPYEAAVSVIDLLAMTGAEALKYIL